MFRTWPALFALGAGLLHVALGAAVVSGAPDAAAVAVLGTLVVLGLAELVWATAALRAGRSPAPRAAAAGAVIAVALGSGALIIGCSVAAVAAASALAVAAGAVAARGSGGRGRRAAQEGVAARRPRSAIGIVVGAMLVAVVATPALATTDAGLAAPAHEHLVDPGQHAGH